MNCNYSEVYKNPQLLTVVYLHKFRDTYFIYSKCLVTYIYMRRTCNGIIWLYEKTKAKINSSSKYAIGKDIDNKTGYNHDIQVQKMVFS